MAREKAKKKAVRKIEKAVKKAIRKGVDSDWVAQTVEQAQVKTAGDKNGRLVSKRPVEDRPARASRARKRSS